MAKNQPRLSVSIHGREIEFKPPNIKRFSRYTTKLIRGEVGVGARELLQTSANLEPDEVRAIFDKAPAAVQPVTDALLEMAIGDAEVDIKDDGQIVYIKAEGVEVEFGGPNLEQWEKFQSDLRDPNQRPFEVMLALIYTLSTEDEKELGAFFANYPGTVLAVYDAVSSVAGGDVEIAVKKA